MKAIVLPTTDTEALAPFTAWIPEFLLPVVNKPVVEHLIELLARHNIKEVLLIMKHMPHETESYFGDGSRWGVKIAYSLIGTYRGIADALGRVEPSKLEGTILSLPSDLVTDLDLSDFIGLYQGGERNVCLAHADERNPPTLHHATSEEMEELDCFPLILKGPALDGLAAPEWPGKADLVDAYRSSHRAQRIRSTADLLAANRRAVKGEFRSLLIPGKEIQPGIRVGKHSRIHPQAELEGPLLIGAQCNIQGGASIKKGSVIGDLVIIDEEASVEESLVLQRTYVGAHAHVKEGVLGRNWILSMPSMLPVRLGDDLILGDMEKDTLSRQAGRLLDISLALLLLVLTSPAWVLFFSLHLLFPSRKFFASERRMAAFSQAGLDGTLKPVWFNLFLFRSDNLLLRKIPGLLNVIRGDLHLVGISILEEEELLRLPEEWKETRLHGPVGLFHFWELERRPDLEWDEKMVMDSYYAASRTLWGDVKILGRALFAAAVRRACHRP